jgi:hypothetical protein
VKSAKRLLDAVSLPRVDRYTRWVSVFNEETKKPLYSDFFREQTRAADATGLLGEWFKRANGIGILDAMLLTDQMTYLPNDLLVKVDIAAMAVAVSRSSCDRICGEPASKPQAARPDDQVRVEESAPKIAAKRESQPVEDGFWSARRSLVP